MLSFGLLAFAQPWLLAALVTLPAIWLLLRVTPPAPRRFSFPALRLLLRIEEEEETPARTPWWLLALRLAIAALLITALARPLWNPAPPLAGSGPLLLVVDDGWAAAPGWDERRSQLRELLDQAARAERPVMLLRTAPDAEGVRVERTDAVAAREALAGWEAKAWPVDRAAAAQALAGLEPEAGTSVVWLSDGIADRDGAAAAAAGLGDALRRLGSLDVLADPAADRARLLTLPDAGADQLTVELHRPSADGPGELALRALGEGGQIMASATARFDTAELTTRVAFDLPLDLRNRIARIEVAPSAGIGEVVLLDERWRRRVVGLVGSAAASADQPLLSELYFVQRALAPYADVRTGRLEELVAGPLSLLVLTDTGRLSEQERATIEGWVEEGGVLLRFAGPRLAAAGGTDPLLPVPLRAGDRQLGGVLSWSEPSPIASFASGGPFAGLPLNPEATVRRQVLAEPGPHLRDATFAALADGTPLVTGARSGRGWLLLMHTTANTAWTDLPLSGLFVDMLRRVLVLAPGAGGGAQGTLEADRVLGADGILRDAPAFLGAVAAADFAALRAGPTTPPGLWRPPRAVGDDGTHTARTALNLQTAVTRPEALGPAALGAAPQPFRATTERDLTPVLLTLALVLALIDLAVGLVLRGLVPQSWRRRPLAPTTAALAAILLIPGLAQAQSEVEPGVQAALETRLAYVRTGIGDIDELSRAGLVGLSRVLAQRTSVETAQPVAVDVEYDELAVYPLLYWPMPPAHPDLPATAVERVERYLRLGGMILFDTKDAGVLFPGQEGGGPGERRLGQLLGEIDLPPLERVAPDHVLTRAFYLLQDFPGRWVGQPVWVDQAPPALNDGVSSVIIGGHDWAGAWAEDEYGGSLLPVVPGGELQREMARRFGVNLVMYALTGNYKTDQVHIPALLERLGQ